MAWVETRSPSFTARHESRAADGAREVLEDLEPFRDGLLQRFPEAPGEVAVVLHSHYAQLALAQPWLPLAQVASTPAGRRYFGGWFAAREIHVLTPDALRRRASDVSGSRAALTLAHRHEYVHLVIGGSNRDLPPPFTPRAFRGYLRWAWLCEGAAMYFSGQQRHLHAAVARRLREGPRPAFPPPARDAALLGGTVLTLLERLRGPEACIELVRSPLADQAAESVIERAFEQQAAAVARAWHEHTAELAAARS